MSDYPPAAAPDFVDRLVMKALGTADLPVPRLPSLYESPTPRAGFQHGDADTEEGDPAIDASSPIRRARTPVSTAQVSAPTPAPPHASPVTSTPALEAANGPRITRAVAGTGLSRRAIVDGEPAAVRATPPAARGFDAAPVEGHPARQASRSAQRVGNDAVSPDTGGSLSVRHEALVAVPRGHPAGPTSRRHHRTEDAPGGAAELRDGVLVPRASGLAFPGVAPRPHGLDRPRRADGPGEEQGADVAVHVTIGRIDVRATPAGASDAKRTPSRGPQPLALDEYLGQRGAR